MLHCLMLHYFVFHYYAKGTRKQIPCDCNKFFCCNRMKLCFRVRIAKLIQKKLLKQNQLRFLTVIFQDGGHEQKYRGSICSPSFG